ncbi:MAG: endonuclease/exonuclease/phosphatase family protein [Myxococcota bacterium]
MHVFTWNVLHRVHGENHHEPAIARWADEPRRIAGVVARIEELLDEGAEAALLQEVSGDLLAALRNALDGWLVLAHQYPRLPRQKRPNDMVRDASEHLVVIARPGAVVRRAQTFGSDAGKGFLAVETAGVLVVSTHVSFGEKRADQLAALARLVAETSGPLIIGGDFNVERPVVEAGVGLGALPLRAGSAKTRATDEGGVDIDHLLVRDVDLREARVLAHDELSDHSPVAS